VKNFVNGRKQGMILILPFCKELATTPQPFCRILPNRAIIEENMGET
jgi:hypothetical protein